MTTSKHTPGPWKWEGSNNCHGDTTTWLEPAVLQIYESHGGGMTPDEADARVIEAAPALVDAVEELIGVCEAVGRPEDEPKVDRARDALGIVYGTKEAQE